MAKKASEVVEGEKLDILIGSRPLADLPDDKKKEAVKENVLRILNEKYGVEEEDFLSAELEIVPAGKARDCGLDRSMIAGYGQDDRVCAYTSLLALLEMKAPKRTSCCLLVDKEEIGSVGATGTARWLPITASAVRSSCRIWRSYGHHTPGSFPLHAAMCWSSLISPPAAHGSSRCATHLTEPGRS